jgi:protein-disulfide isomerase
MAKRKDFPSKRQAVREKRKQQQRRQRLVIVLVVAGVALLVAAGLAYPSIRNALQPVGEIISITPQARPMVDGTALGDPNAPVRMDVYVDFQCPACRGYSDQIENQVVENYVTTGQVYYVFRHFPFLDDGVPSKESDQAANASMCASEQDQFWDYHDILFANWDGENKGAFSDNRLIAYAESLGLDMEAFNACFQENRYQEEIEADLAAGRRTNVQGTPSVFVQGQLITPGFVPSLSEISTAVEAALQSNE